MSSKNKIAIITGASRGLGKDMALQLAKNGCNIIFTFNNNKTEADKVVNEIMSLGKKAIAFQLDLSQIHTFDTFVEKVIRYIKENYVSPNFDFLINNAGTGLHKNILETTEAEFDEMFKIHLKGVYFLTQKFIPYLNDGGRIINISSGLTRMSFVGSSAYAMMKGAVEIFTKYLAKELGARKITVNTVAPGAIATDFGGGSNRDNQEKRSIISSVTALGRVGEAQDIGGVVAFLCGEESAWVNGQRIEVSGGMML